MGMSVIAAARSGTRKTDGLLARKSRPCYGFAGDSGQCPRARAVSRGRHNGNDLLDQGLHFLRTMLEITTMNLWAQERYGIMPYRDSVPGVTLPWPP
jgi:hypothetical protein